MRRKESRSAEEILAGAKRIAVLDTVTNPTNGGAIFRSAAALGMDAVLLTKGCSDPLYRRFARVSMGTVFQIPWTYVGGGAEDWISVLKRYGFTTVALALEEKAVSIEDERLKNAERIAVVLGNEGNGLPREDVEDRLAFYEEMIDSQYSLTLFTCTIGGRARVTVRCSERNDL